MPQGSHKNKVLDFPVNPALREDGPWFVTHADQVTWRGYEMDADPSSFVALTDTWGFDDQSVFVQHRRKRNIDRASFRLLNPVFAVDCNAVYDWSGAVKQADAKSFEVLDSGIVAQQELMTDLDFMSYAIDQKYVWFHEQMYGRATAIKSADRTTFQSFRNGYGADVNCVYWGKRKLPKSDPSTWLALGNGYSMDHRRVWFQNRVLSPVQRHRFLVVNVPTIPSLATDGDRFFANDATITQTEFERELSQAAQDLRRRAKTIAGEAKF